MSGPPLVELGGEGRPGVATAYGPSGCEDASRVVVPAAWLRAAGWVPASVIEAAQQRAIEYTIEVFEREMLRRIEAMRDFPDASAIAAELTAPPLGEATP